MKTLIYISIFSLLSLTGKAQDIHFSKFISAPLILNPANTTNYNANWSLISNYRNQGYDTGDPFVTKTLAFDFPIFIKTERFGLGMIWINDLSSLKSLSVNKLFLSTAYFLKVSGYSYLHMGLQAGLIHKRFNLNELSFPDQYDMSIGYFNPELSTSETLDNQTLNYLDLNWGLIWSLKKEKFTIETGAAMFHYNTPNESFSAFDFNLKPKYVAHAFVEKAFNNNFFIKPKVLYVYQNMASELLLGSGFGILFPGNNLGKNFNLGIFLRGGFNRTPNSLIFKTGIAYKNYEFSIGYDLDIGSSGQFIYPSRAFEFSFSYRRPDTGIKSKMIPCSVF